MTADLSWRLDSCCHTSPLPLLLEVCCKACFCRKACGCLVAPRASSHCQVSAPRCFWQKLATFLSVKLRLLRCCRNVTFTNITAEAVYEAGGWWGAAEALYITAIPRTYSTKVLAWACLLAAACLPACLLACLLVCLLACLLACLPACLPACLLACLLACCHSSCALCSHTSVSPDTQPAFSPQAGAAARRSARCQASPFPTT